MQHRPDELRAGIASRLERVCGHMSEVDFAKLVEDVAQTTLRLAEIEARGLPSVSAPSGVPTFKEPETRRSGRTPGGGA